MKSLGELQDLTGRVALITGGAGHVAEAFAEALAELGADLYLLDISEERVRLRAGDLAARFKRNIVWGVADIGSEAQVQLAIDHALAVHGRLDILVNNAAYPPSDPSPLPESLAEWETHLGVILTGAFLVTRASIPALKKSGRGTIVNVGSMHGLVGPDLSLYEGTSMTSEAYYAAGKGGIVQLTRYWATTLAPTVRVNCIAPGGIWRGQPESFHQRFRRRTPLGRMAREEDLKGVLAFLASDLSAYVTGQVIAVDGGWTAW